MTTWDSRKFLGIVPGRPGGGSSWGPSRRRRPRRTS